MTAIPACVAAPRVLLIEPTSRCNLACGMCPRQTPGCVMTDGDLAFETLAALETVLPGVERVSLAGLGEPLLHPQIVEIVAWLRARLPATARIGLQTNGLLVTQALADRLAAAGLDQLCLSVDALETAPNQPLHGGSFLPAIESAFACFREARTRAGRPLELGVECVLMRSNRRALPGLLDWAAGQGANFVLVSHLLPPAPQWAGESLSNPNAAAAVALFRQAEAETRRQGLNIQDILKLQLRFRLTMTGEERRLQVVEAALREEACQQGVPINLKSLVAWAADEAMQELPDLFAVARQQAARHGLRLHLPSLAAADVRECPFLARNIACLDAHGNVAPCHFLWHTHVTAEQGRPKRIAATFLGRLGAADAPAMDALWNASSSRAFRAEAQASASPRCYDCAASPCSELIQAAYGDACDCLGGGVPCGHCPWPLGLVSCLGTEGPPTVAASDAQVAA
ncbi:radical SAM protein [Megalodesulfovibrio gigas]|nr:radical SAM protein [Megalodesulfovibrio gigas]